MKSAIRPLLLLTCVGLAASAQAQVSVRGGVDITINQPGVYGRVVLGGGQPLPPLVFPQPVIVRAAPVAVQAQPVYLYVPPGHTKKWSRHCHRYNACNQRVYFVREAWVQERYALAHPQHGHKPKPIYHGHREGGGDDHHNEHGKGKGHGRH